MGKFEKLIPGIFDLLTFDFLTLVFLKVVPIYLYLYLLLISSRTLGFLHSCHSFKPGLIEFVYQSNLLLKFS